MNSALRPSMPVVGIFAIFLAGCAPAPYVVPQEDAGRQKAFFAEFPDALFAVAESVCDGPAETLVKRTRTYVECESLPSPEAAATLILRFDGDIERLPTLVNSLRATTQRDGYLVEAEYFFRVPQLDADTVVVRVPQRQADRAIQRVFIMAGGELFTAPI